MQVFIAALADVHWWVVVLCAVVDFIIGSLWFGPLLGTPWRRAAGMTEAGISNTNIPWTTTQMVFWSFVTYAVLALLLQLTSMVTLPQFLVVAGIVWLGFVLPGYMTRELFEQRPRALALITGTYELIALLLGAVVLHIWG